MGLEVVGDVKLTYFLDGKVDLRAVTDPAQLICDESILHLVNLDAQKPETVDAADELDCSLEVDRSSDQDMKKEASLDLKIELEKSVQANLSPTNDSEFI